MRNHPLGRTGLFVSELCLGTMTFGGTEGIWGKIGDLGQARPARGDDRVDQSLYGLAGVRSGDLGERLGGAELAFELIAGDPQVAGGGEQIVAVQTLLGVPVIGGAAAAALTGGRDGGKGAAADHDGYGRCGGYLLSGAASHSEQCSLASIKTRCPHVEWYVKPADRRRAG